MKDLIKASEAALDIVEKYNLKDEDIQNKAAKLKATLDRAKDFQQNVNHLQRIINSINEKVTARQTQQP